MRRCEKKRKEVGGSIQRGGERHIREENRRDRKDDVEHRFATISHKIQTLIDQYLGGTFDGKSVLRGTKSHVTPWSNHVQSPNLIT